MRGIPTEEKALILIIRVFDPQGNVVAEEGKRSAAVQEYLDITATGVGIVRGTIHTPDRSPVADVIVRAFDRNLREEDTARLHRHRCGRLLRDYL